VVFVDGDFVVQVNFLGPDHIYTITARQMFDALNVLCCIF